MLLIYKKPIIHVTALDTPLRPFLSTLLRVSVPFLLFYFVFSFLLFFSFLLLFLFFELFCPLSLHKLLLESEPYGDQGGLSTSLVHIATTMKKTA